MTGERDPLDERIAAADAGGVAPAPIADAPAPVADEAAQWIGAALQYGAVIRAMLPDRAQPHWTEDRLRSVGVELAGAAQYYGWKLGAILTHPLAKLALVSFPLAWPLIEPYAAPYLAAVLGGKEKLAPAEAGAAAQSAPAAAVIPVKPLPE